RYRDLEALLPQIAQFLQVKDIAHGAHAEEDVSLVAVEMTLAAGARKDRHHAGDAAAAGDAEQVLLQAGIESRLAERPEHLDSRAHRLAGAEPLGDAAAGLSL